MVTCAAAVNAGLAIAHWSFGPLVAAEEAAPVLERLDPPRRAIVVMALLGLVLTGLALITCVMLGAHWVRRLARQRPGSRLPARPATAAAERIRLRDSLASILPEAIPGETVQIDATSKETKAE
jgi:hypothetical protein